MLFELFLKFLFGIAGFLLDFLPDMSGLDVAPGTAVDISGFIDVLSYGFLVFPADLFFTFIGNVTFWLGVQMIWALVEWIYKKIPGVS